MLNLNMEYWMWDLNVTGDESDMKNFGSNLRLQTSCAFVFADVLTRMGRERVVVVVADYWAHLMVGQYLLLGKMGLTATIFKCGIFAASG